MCHGTFKWTLLHIICWQLREAIRKKASFYWTLSKKGVEPESKSIEVVLFFFFVPFLYNKIWGTCCQNAGCKWTNLPFLSLTALYNAFIFRLKFFHYTSKQKLNSLAGKFWALGLTLYKKNYNNNNNKKNFLNPPPPFPSKLTIDKTFPTYMRCKPAIIYSFIHCYINQAVQYTRSNQKFLNNFIYKAVLMHQSFM